ncbi:MAG TPA: amidohydrolase [Candidatus Acidoferrales bacterium]|nr:amidohydrolase [Candidatus Acidoferrales bacterium]
MEADLILAAGAVYPLGRQRLRRHSHLAVGGGRVLAVGGREVMGLRGRGTQVIQLRGAAVLPGFNDAHAHVVYFGLTRFAARLLGATSITEIQDRLRSFARTLGPDEWLQGLGYTVAELAEARPPHRRDLDGATGRRPAFIDERGGHTRVANSAALRRARITSRTPDPKGGRIGRDPDGKPNGLLLEAAMRLVADVQPPPSLERRQRGILLCQRLLLSRGVTSVGAAVNRGFADDLRAYQRLAESGQLRMRVNQFLSWELLEAARGLNLRSASGGPLLRAGPIKVFVDGGAGPGTVALRSGRGLWRTPPKELQELVARASEAGLQVAAHAVGDAAIEAFLDAVEAAAAPDLRHRIEHCTACPPDLRRRAARLGVVAVMQPLFALYGRQRLGDRFGSRLRRHLAAHRALREAGVELAFSSDLPVVTDPNPWDGLAAAVLDREQGLTRWQALRAYTWGGAYSSFEEDEKGALEPGQLADFQILAEDPLGLRVKAWTGLRPQLVAVGGVPVYRAPSS